MFPVLKTILCLALLLFIAEDGSAQKNDLFHVFTNQVIEAEKHFHAGRIDSALLLCNKAIAAGKKSGYEKYFLYSRALLITGNIYTQKKEWVKGHDLHYSAYHNAVKYRHSTEEIESFTALNQLHADIMKNDLPFPYKAPVTTIPETVGFQVGGAERSGDSMILTLFGGYLDGITDSSLKAEIYSRHDSKLKREFSFLANGTIRKITPNRTIVTVKGNYDIRAGDMAFTTAQVPVHFNKTSLKKQMLYGVFITDNYKQRIFERRYYHYFFDANSDSTVARILRNNIEEIVDLFAADTATDKTYAAIIPSGIFAGMNVMTALNRSMYPHLNYFMHFVFEFPAKYIGNNFRFSEIYATWIINSTPLVKDDIRDALLSEMNEINRKRLAQNLSSQVQEHNLGETWFIDGLKFISEDNIAEASKYSSLLEDAAISRSGEKYKGWSLYLAAQAASKNDNMSAADSLLKQALTVFSSAGDTEGIIWVNSALKNLEQSSKVKFTVQTGHIAPYEIAMSPNPRYFATGSEDFLIKIWDITQAKEVKTITGHTNEIRSICYSPDGKYLASAALDTTIRIWNAFDHSTVQVIHSGKPVTTIRFTPDGKHLVSAGTDSLVKFWDHVNGKLAKVLPQRHRGRVTDICFNPVNPNRMLTSGYDSLVLKWDLTKEDTTGWFRERGRVLSVKLSNNGKYMSTVSTDKNIHVWAYEDFAKSRHLFRDTIATKSTASGTYYSQEAFSADSRYLVHPSDRNRMTITDLQQLMQSNYNAPAPYGDFLSAIHFSNDGNYLIQKFFSGGRNRIIDFSGWELGAKLNEKVKEWKQYNNPPMYPQFSNDGKRLFIANSYNTLFDLSNGSTTFLYSGGQTFHNRFLKNNETESAYIFMDSVRVVHLETGKIIASFGLNPTPFHLLPKEYQDSLNDYLVRERVSSLTFSHNDSLLYIGGTGGTLTAYETRTKKVIFSKHLSHPEDAQVTWIVVDSVNGRILVQNNSSILYSLNASNGAIMDTAVIEGSGIALAPEGIYISGADGILYKLDSRTLDIARKIQLRTSTAGAGIPIVSPDKKSIAVSAVDNNYLCVVDVLSDKVKYCIYDHDFVGSFPTISPDNSMIATGGFDNKVNIYEFASGKYIGSIHTPLDDDHLSSDATLKSGFDGYVLNDAEGHYMAPKKTLEGIVFNFRNNAFNYEQFDLQFNRPDIVLGKFNKADAALVQSYKEAYRKRIRKLGLTESDVKIDVHLPIITIPDRYNSRPTTSSNKFEITVECYDSRYQLQSLQVIVNNVPLFGSRGKSISGTRAIEKISVPLSSDDNIIKVYCVNEKGAKSLRSDFTIYSTYKDTTARTYFIGIAVASYQDASMNLTYTAKDVRDLAAKFKELYPNIIIDTLINKNATRNNILKLKAKLMRTSVNDKVFMAVTGHGLLSDSLDFYYATYNVDFSKPEVNGLKYEDLENLLNDIPCRQKLLLIDACHSGALDKDELLKKGVIQKGNVKTKNTRSTIKVKKSKLRLNDAFELMQTQFADLSGNNGTVVISAAGGLEYAFESAKWNNGVFTYSVLSTLDQSHTLSVQQLQKIVSMKVKELTGGLQKPNSRKENLDYNWKVK